MSSCGVCGGTISNTLVKHAELCEDDIKAQPMRYEPEIDDLIRNEEESNA